MALLRREPVRVVKTRAGPRYVVQVPYPSSPIPGWRAYAVTALGPGRFDGPLHLTVYDRMGDLPDGTRAA
ncbi:MAG: hypothetical protein R3B97_02115 [Dehalococcoidia bacterium]